MSAQAEQVTATAQDLEQLAQQLQDAVSVFHLPEEAMAGVSQDRTMPVSARQPMRVQSRY